MDPRERTEKFGIDLAADPFVPNDFEVVEHIKGPLLEWNPHRPKIELVLMPGQRKGIMTGAKIQEDLKAFEGLPVNANALDYLLLRLKEAPWVIPHEWRSVEMHKSKHILFWGTLYKFDGSLCVRSLDWNQDARDQVWRSGYCWVENHLNSQYPAAMVRIKAVSY